MPYQYFLEISRVERDLKRHKAKYEEEVSCLKDQIRSLEEEKENFQEFISRGEVDRTEDMVKDERYLTNFVTVTVIDLGSKHWVSTDP